MALVDSVGVDLEKIPKPVRYKKPGPAATFFASLGSILLFSTMIFIAINFPAFYKILRYNLKPKTFAKNAPQVQEYQGTSGAPPVKQYADNTMFIPKIGVEAPINWDAAEPGVMDSLQSGLVQIAGTGMPGEKKNIFITGHSSNYWWREGDYNTIFALLPELEQGDEIFINYEGKMRKYLVFDKQEVSKNAVENYVGSDEEQLTLMTCVPVGTNLRRLLVFAKPI